MSTCIGNRYLRVNHMLAAHMLAVNRTYKYVHTSTYACAMHERTQVSGWLRVCERENCMYCSLCCVCAPCFLQTINEKKSDAQHHQIIALLTTLQATYGQALPLPENLTSNASAPSTPVGVSSGGRAEKRPADDGTPGHGPKRLATYTSTPTSLPASSATPPTVSRISGRGDLCGCLCEL